MSAAWSSARGDRADRVGADRVAALDELDELVDDGARLGDPVAVAVERELVAAERDRAAEPLAQRVEHAVGDAGELCGDLVGYGDHVLHAPSVGGEGYGAGVGGLTVLYDEDCGFCTALARRLERYRGLRAAAIGSPAGMRLLRDLGDAERYATVHVVDSSGRRRSGGAAVAPLLRALPGCRALAGACERLPARDRRCLPPGGAPPGR